MTMQDRQAKWLVVDDDPDALWLLHHVLTTITSAEIHCCATPTEALRVFSETPREFDLVITDLELPGFNGDQLRQAMRKIEPRLKMILATANPDWNSEAALLKGFDGFLQKPFSIMELREAVSAAGRETALLQAA